MKGDVYFIPAREKEGEEALGQRLERALRELDLLDFVKSGDFVALKTHFGEEGSSGYIRPLHLKMAGAMLKEKGARAFLTETSTLYTGMRSNAVSHLHLACKHGFGYDQTGLPIVMADGLLGTDELEVEIPGKLFTRVKLAAAIVRASAMLLFSHFTGHLATGFGAALKNLGMGCASRKGKLNQHSTAKPSVKTKKCTGCGVCPRWCPASAIVLIEEKARIDPARCIGCGECLAVCRFDAIGYNWAETYVQLQKKVVEHAWGVVRSKPGKLLCANFLTRITKDCDCISAYQPIVPDVGILLATDPVALDAASLDLVEEAARQPLPNLAYDIPYRVQIDYAREIGFGSPDYRLQRLDP